MISLKAHSHPVRRCLFTVDNSSQLSTWRHWEVKRLVQDPTAGDTANVWTQAVRALRDKEVKDKRDGLTTSFLRIQSRQEVVLSRVLVFGIAYLSMVTAGVGERMGQMLSNTWTAWWTVEGDCFLMVSILPAMQEARSHAKNERVKWGQGPWGR